MFWYYNSLIIASYIVKDHVRSWEGGLAGGRGGGRGAMKWNEFSGRDSGDTGEKKCSKPQAASHLSCMGTHVWSSSLLNRSVAEWVTKNKTTATQKPDILWLLKRGLKGWVAKWHPVSPINLKSSEAKNIFSKNHLSYCMQHIYTKMICNLGSSGNPMFSLAKS